MEARDIIIRPLVTEMTTELMEEGKYVFVVAKEANKIEIAKAVSTIFNVKVESVNTVNVLGKVKRMGRNICFSNAASASHKASRIKRRLIKWQ